MVDFVRCSNKDCVSKSYCRRQTDGVSKNQYRNGIHNFQIWSDEDKCNSFVPNEKYKTFQILKTI